MTFAVAAILIALQAPSTYPDRVKFLRALKSLPDHSPVSEVTKALGKPDRIEHRSDYEGKLVGDGRWCYGTDGPHGAPTLASFQVVNGRIGYHPVRVDAPSPSVISESELRKGMHLVLDSMPSGQDQIRIDLLDVWVAKTVNALLPFGESKCKAIIGECGRIMEGDAQLDPCPFFLEYSLFDPPNPPGYFNVFGPVWNSQPPKSHVDHPRWPVEIKGNVVNIEGSPMGGFGGYAPSFVTEFQELRNRIHLRKSPLTVPM